MSVVSTRRFSVLVLGGCGYLGSAISHHLARAGHDVTAMSLRTHRPEPDHPTGLTLVQGDATSSRDVLLHAETADVIVNAAGCMSSSRGWRVQDEAAASVYTEPVQAVLAAAVHMPRPPLVLTLGAVGQADAAAQSPSDYYLAAKQVAEDQLLEAGRSGLIHPVALGLPTVHGVAPGCRRLGTGVITAMVRRALQGEPLTLWGTGQTRRTLIHVADVARAIGDIITAAGTPYPAQHIPVGGESVSLQRMFHAVARAVRECTGIPVLMRSVSPPTWASSADTRDVEVDDSILRRHTGWTPRLSLDGTLPDLIRAVQREPLTSDREEVSV